MENNLHCQVCNEAFPDHNALMVHKLQAPGHITCVFCGIDFRTVRGRQCHQDQNHPAQQNLTCCGCGEKFTRAGSYISHLESQTCPVIHRQVFDERRKAAEIKHTQRATGTLTKLGSFPETPPLRQASKPFVAPVLPECEEEDLLIFEDSPVRPAWGLEESFKNAINISDPGTLAEAQRKSSTQEDAAALLSLFPPAAKLTTANKAWIDLMDTYPDAPLLGSALLPKSPPRIGIAAVQTDANGKEELHEYDPNNPSFDARKYLNIITGKYRCPWSTCRGKVLKNIISFRQHLKSNAHMNARLRCPACLRQYGSCTALVQHAESQAKICDIRDSPEYRAAIEQMTGGFIDTSGRHADATVRYTAPNVALSSEDMLHKSLMARDEYWAKREEKRQAVIEWRGKNEEW